MKLIQRFIPTAFLACVIFKNYLYADIIVPGAFQSFQDRIRQHIQTFEMFYCCVYCTSEDNQKRVNLYYPK